MLLRREHKHPFFPSERLGIRVAIAAQAYEGYNGYEYHYYLQEGFGEEALTPVVSGF